MLLLNIYFCFFVLEGASENIVLNVYDEDEIVQAVGAVKLSQILQSHLPFDVALANSHDEEKNSLLTAEKTCVSIDRVHSSSSPTMLPVDVHPTSGSPTPEQSEELGKYKSFRAVFSPRKCLTLLFLLCYLLSPQRYSQEGRDGAEGDADGGDEGDTNDDPNINVDGAHSQLSFADAARQIVARQSAASDMSSGSTRTIPGIIDEILVSIECR